MDDDLGLRCECRRDGLGLGHGHLAGIGAGASGSRPPREGGRDIWRGGQRHRAAGVEPGRASNPQSIPDGVEFTLPPPVPTLDTESW